MVLQERNKITEDSTRATQERICDNLGIISLCAIFETQLLEDLIVENKTTQKLLNTLGNDLCNTVNNIGDIQEASNNNFEQRFTEILVELQKISNQLGTIELEITDRKKGSELLVKQLDGTYINMYEQPIGKAFGVYSNQGTFMFLLAWQPADENLIAGWRTLAEAKHLRISEKSIP